MAMMNYSMLKEYIHLLEEYEASQACVGKEADIEGFKQWVCTTYKDVDTGANWEGKENGRSADSVINTLLVRLYHYARYYAKSAIGGSNFSTPDEFIFLITLNVNGPMTKMELIKENIHQKPIGIKIINGLINKGWVFQSNSPADKRSKVISLTQQGAQALEAQMDKIRKASTIVTGRLSEQEKVELIRLMSQLDTFHYPLYLQQMKAPLSIDEMLADL